MTATATEPIARREPELPSTASDAGPATGAFVGLVRTSDDKVATLLRVVLGTVMLAHGAQKVLGWFGGYGFEGTLGYLTQQLHIPLLLAVLAIVAEFAGGLGLITGLLSRVAALGIFTVMLVAVATVHRQVGFFMNWGGTQHGEGYEYHLLAMALAAAVMIKGGGAWSVDGLLSRKK